MAQDRVGVQGSGFRLGLELSKLFLITHLIMFWSLHLYLKVSIILSALSNGVAIFLLLYLSL